MDRYHDVTYEDSYARTVGLTDFIILEIRN